MRSILCYGDSNTWGSIPGESGRHVFAVRWPGALQKLLGAEYLIIEEGLGGRTTAWDDPFDPGRNGKTYLPTALQTNSPIDLLIVMLGTNDLKKRFSLSAFDIAQGAAELLKLATNFEPKISEFLLISPPNIVATDNLENKLGFQGAIDKSKELAEHYEYFTKKYMCHFFDAAKLIQSSPIDGIHLEAEAHLKLSQGLYFEVKKILK